MHGTFPASVITGAGLEYRREDRGASAGDHTVQNGSNLTIMDASIFLTGPLGKHLAFFIEFPMFESKAWEFTPTGPAEANDRPVGSTVLRTEKPVFEVAKFCLKLIGEYRHHEFEDRASTPQKATLTDDGFTLRAMVGF